MTDSTATATATPAVPKPEHPRPQSTRPDWLNLNGPWQFERDRGDSGLERGLLERDLAEEILVPFAPESTASGIGDVDFLTAVWYRRTVRIPAGWSGRRVLLHFGAVDHDATVWVGGEEVARHRGGFTSFTADLGVRADEEELTVVVRARDTRDEPQARGKQATWFENTSCFYTRTTGIWQTVWLEPVPEAHIRSAHIEPQRADSSFTVTPELSHRTAGLVFEAVLADAAGEITRSRIPAGDMGARVTLRIPRSAYACGHPRTRISTTSRCAWSTPRAMTTAWSTRSPPTAASAPSRSTAATCSSTAVASSSASCSTRTTGPTRS
ncbi:Beta-glucuronidase [Clavibacter michiganensis subsp. michiganensis]|uniref:Beta-glucuronidase n=1 Tax=Clavibacter michiganensis subsp. michiganensis TaxID=33013 RepID=A0A251XMN9_CLAMM|nr:Beta-glucuronidase [Clavibacter michiganensis subsp. michiganensis]OUE04727.1 Beta-glucuronidase [Clavibacter michiganensis subsp. michiganensis]